MQNLLDEIRDTEFRYFDPVLLERYAAREGRYVINDEDFDGSVQGRDFKIRFDKRRLDTGGVALVPFGPEFVSLPARERVYWEEFELTEPNLVPIEEDKAFLAAYRQNYLGEFVDWPPSEGE